MSQDASRIQQSKRGHILSVAVIAIALLVGAALQLILSVPYAVVLPSCSRFPKLCSEVLAGAAPAAGEQQFGRWKAPTIGSLENLRQNGSFVKRMFQTKSWSYISVSTPRYFIALTPVQFNYVEDVYLSVVDKSAQRLVNEYHWQMPFGRALTLAPTSMEGCSKFTGWKDESVELCFTGGSWHFNVNLPYVRAKIQIKKGSEALVLWYPLGGNIQRPAYVHKEAGMEAQGSIIALNPEQSSAENVPEPEIFQHGAATIDWTVSRALRETKWQWVSFSCFSCSVTNELGQQQYVPVGINLSRLVYDINATNISAENALWINHKVHALPIAIQVDIPPQSPGTNVWKIYANSSACELNLTFTPHGIREDHTGADVLGIVSDFVQPFGVFSGMVTLRSGPHTWRIVVDNVYGVCENHRAVW